MVGKPEDKFSRDVAHIALPDPYTVGIKYLNYNRLAETSVFTSLIFGPRHEKIRLKQSADHP